METAVPSIPSPDAHAKRLIFSRWLLRYIGVRTYVHRFINGVTFYPKRDFEKKWKLQADEQSHSLGMHKNYHVPVILGIYGVIAG